MSENTVNAGLRRLGYTNDQHVAHGFRSTASTLLNEQGYDPDVIELQLAHMPRGVRPVDDRSQRLEDRCKMMQDGPITLTSSKPSSDRRGEAPRCDASIDRGL
jgi:hypothetical protein